MANNRLLDVDGKPGLPWDLNADARCASGNALGVNYFIIGSLFYATSQEGSRCNRGRQQPVPDGIVETMVYATSLAK